jgi:chorismate-pyruvate lyase
MQVIPSLNDRHTFAFRADWHQSLTHSHFDLFSLSVIQRILLVSDGTLTKILEAYLCEKMQVVKLSERVVSISQEIRPLNLSVGKEVIERKICLRGQNSQRNWLYAESIIVPERLEEKFRHKLLHSQEPIGKLWLEHKMETFKEIITLSREAAGDLSGYFQVEREDYLLGRTYLVFSNRRPVMMITEKFPESYFMLASLPQSRQPAKASSPVSTLE